MPMIVPSPENILAYKTQNRMYIHNLWRRYIIRIVTIEEVPRVHFLKFCHAKFVLGSNIIYNVNFSDFWSLK